MKYCTINKENSSCDFGKKSMFYENRNYGFCETFTIYENRNCGLRKTERLFIFF
jgi:hypothetical protein